MKRKTFIIGVSGKKQSGKNTLCDSLYKWLRRSFPEKSVKMYSFADALKEKVCIDTLGLSYEQCYGTDEQKNSLTTYKWEKMTDDIRYSNSIKTEKIRHGGTNRYEDIPVMRLGFMTAREIMKIVGTDIFRNYFDDDVWVKTTLRNIKQSSAKVILISDVRFPGEVESLINEGGYVIRLLRDVCETDAHESETALDDYVGWNYIISNNDTIESLYRKVDYLLEKNEF